MNVLHFWITQNALNWGFSYRFRLKCVKMCFSCFTVDYELYLLKKKKKWSLVVKHNPSLKVDCLIFHSLASFKLSVPWQLLNRTVLLCKNHCSEVVIL